MRRAVLAALIALLTGIGVMIAQTPAADPPAQANDIPLPPRPVPVPAPAVEGPPPPPPTPYAPAPPLPPPPQLPPPPLPDAALDGFAVRFWVSADYLLWWIKDARLPALVTTGLPADVVPGALGQPGTQVLFGGDPNNPVRSGGRFRAGYWLTPDQTFGLDGTFFFLGTESIHFGAVSDGSAVLARPFFNVNSNREDAFLVAFPGKQGGAVLASLANDLWGAEANLRGMLFRGPSYQVSLLGGFRFLELNESLHIREIDTLVPQSFLEPRTWETAVDHFHTRSQFYGGQIGTDLMWGRGRFFVDILSKVALGASHECAGINGWSAFANSAGQSGWIGVGQLALPSNSGRSGKDEFAVVPEVGINLGYALTQHIRLTIGYTFLYWSSVFRAGDQIDRAVNTTEFPALVNNAPVVGPARPNFTFKDSDFWAQGLNFGLQFRY